MLLGFGFGLSREDGMQFTEMVKTKDGRQGALLNLNLDRKRDGINKGSINPEVKESLT